MWVVGGAIVEQYCSVHPWGCALPASSNPCKSCLNAEAGAFGSGLGSIYSIRGDSSLVKVDDHRQGAEEEEQAERGEQLVCRCRQVIRHAAARPLPAGQLFSAVVPFIVANTGSRQPFRGLAVQTARSIFEQRPLSLGPQSTPWATTNPFL